LSGNGASNEVISEEQEFKVTHEIASLERERELPKLKLN
jgi:hypothetical protein